MENIFEVHSEWFSTIIGVAGGLAAYFFGGWDEIIQCLFIFSVIDYATGLGQAFVNGTVSSKKGAKGFFKKFMIFFIIAVANKLDVILAMNGLLRNGTCFFYIANEAISILENGSKMGLPIPDKLQKTLEQLRESEDE